MALIRKPFFYSSEMKRVIVQLLALFSGYQVITGTQYDNTERFLDIPMIYGNMSKLGAFIMRGASDNTMSYIPAGALTMTSLRRNDELRRVPYHSEKFNYIERAMTTDGTVIAGVPGKKKTVERFMPVSHQMGFEVSFWTSNEDQRFQMIEQIGAIYAVQMDFLTSNSPADWTALNSILFEGNYDLGSVRLGDAQNDPYYTISFPFIADIMLSLPAKVYDTKFIQSIHVPIYELNAEMDFDTMPELDELVIRADSDEILRFENLREPPKPKKQD